MSCYPHECEGTTCFCRVAMDSSDLQEELNPELQAALFANRTVCDPPSYATGDLFEPLAGSLAPVNTSDGYTDFRDVSCQSTVSTTTPTRQPTPMSMDPQYGAYSSPQAPLQFQQDFSLTNYDDKNLVLGQMAEKPPRSLATMSETAIADLANDEFQSLIKYHSPDQANQFRALRRRVKNRRCAAETAKRRKKKHQGMKEDYVRLQEEVKRLRKTASDVSSQNTELNKRAVQAEAKVDEQAQTIQLLQQQLQFLQMNLNPPASAGSDESFQDLLKTPTLGLAMDFFPS
eukprot:m.41051 g.41051  ORF g.41051 m.41051 type:complete len:288 (+) comp12801_c1_seq4:387-1250(+)